MATVTNSDTLPNSIPRLDDQARNWVIFRLRFSAAVAAKGKWGHFDGSSTRPVFQDNPMTAEQTKQIADWDADEASANFMLQQRIPDAILIRTNDLANVADRWALISHESTVLSITAQTHERKSFLSLKCGEKDNVRTFLESLRSKRESLMQQNVFINEDDYRSTVITCLPSHISSFAAQWLSNAETTAKSMITLAQATNQTLTQVQIDRIRSVDPATLVNAICEESDRRLREREARGNSGGGKGGGSAKERDEAMSAAPSGGGGRGRGGGNGQRKPRGQAGPDTECWNCHEKGHFAWACPKKDQASGAKGEGSKASTTAKAPSKGGSANAATDADSEDEGAWCALEADLFESDDETDDGSTFDVVSAPRASDTELDDSDGSLPGLLDISDTEDDGSAVGDSSDWFSEMDEEDIPAHPAENAVPPRKTYKTTVEDYFSDEDEEVLSDDDNASVDSFEFIAKAELKGERAKASGDTRRELYDSGALRHISPYRDDFADYVEIAPREFSAANEQKFHAVGQGEVTIDVPNGADTTHLTLTEVLYSPEVGYTLVSVGRLDEAGFEVSFKGGQCTIRDDGGMRIGEVPRSKGSLYRVRHDAADAAGALAAEEISVNELHRRMGHISPAVAEKLVRNGFVTGIRLDTSSGTPTFCESCVYAKSTRKPVGKNWGGEQAAKFCDRVHSDVWGPAPTESIGGRRYYVTFTDDCTRHTHLYLLKRKDGAEGAYEKYAAWCDTQHGTKVKVLRSDRGGEYTGKAFTVRLERDGTVYERTVHDTPEHNGVAERLNRTLAEKMRAMLHDSGLPKSLWGEAAHHAVWLKNRTSTRALGGMTPYEKLTGTKPDLSGLRAFGDRVWVHDTSQSKLDGRARVGRWVGFDKAPGAHRVYWPDKHTVTVERSVRFEPVDAGLEGELDAGVSRPRENQQDKTTPTSVDNAPAPVVEQHATPAEEPAQVPPNPPGAMREKSQRVRKESAYVQRLRSGEGVASSTRSQRKLPRGVQPGSETAAATFDIVDVEGEEEYCFVVETSAAEGVEPQSLAEARRLPEWSEWEKAIKEELDTLERAGTYVEAEAPAGANIVGSKWVFRIKRDADGHVVRRKARLVAQGFSQVPGVDYFDTYAPVAKLASIRTILAIAARYDLALHQVDIKSAYLNGELEEDEVIYMKHAPGYKPPNSGTRVLRLVKTLYGLKQSGRRWYQKFRGILCDHLGFKQCDVDQAVFYRADTESFMIVAVHVDDCTLVAKTDEVVTEFKKGLGEHVEVTDLGELHWLLGMEVRRDRDARTIHVSQHSYIESILRRYNMEELKPLSTPMDDKITLSTSMAPVTSDDFAIMRDVDYRGAVGALMYAALGTRPDIAFAVTTLSRFSSNPGPAHWDAVKRVFRYLNGTKKLWLWFGGVGDVEEDGTGGMTGYADADGQMQEDRRAISGYAFLIDGGAVSWSSKRQEIISLSTTESEYVAATHASKEAIWLRQLIGQIFSPLTSPTTLFCDNQSAIALAKDHQFHARSKHIDIRYHFLRWITEKGTIQLIYCPTDDMVADTLTKALPSTKVKHFANALGLRTI